jgi:Lrp/AsnC family transcriptional regulator, regulator for asnA, asnC and gidA
MARPLLAPIDIRIIQCLHESARSPGSRIATKLGLPESTVRHRLNRLVRLGIIEFAAVVNPLQLGYQIWAQFHLEVQLPKIRAVAQQLARLPPVYFVGITAGGYDVLVGAVFASNAEILNFMAGPMARIPGIMKVSTSSILEVVKRIMTFQPPADVPLPRSTRRKGARALPEVSGFPVEKPRSAGARPSRRSRSRAARP